MSTRGTQKHERETVKAIEALHPSLKASIECRRGLNSHKELIVERNGEVLHRHSLASSPTNEHTSVLQAVRYCRRALREKGILQ